MIDFLELCGFEPLEIQSELPRIEKAFNKLGIAAEDIERGKQRISKFYDIKLKGVRKLLGLYIKELVTLTLAREEGKTKLFYPQPFPGIVPVCVAPAYASKDVYASIPGLLFDVVFGCIFDKLNPILETGEKMWLRSAFAHCGSQKLSIGLNALNLVPMPDLDVTIDIMCNTAPKTASLLYEVFGVPIHNVNVCQDRGFEEFPDVTRGGDFLAQGLRRLAERVGEIVGFEITEELVLEGLRALRDARITIAKINDLMGNSDPLPISASHGTLWTWFSALPLSKDSAQALTDAVATLYEELQEKVAKGEGVVAKGAPKVMRVIAPSLVEPRIEHLAEEVGIAIVMEEAFVFQPDGRLAPDLKEVKGLYQRLAYGALMTSLNNSLRGRISTIIGAYKKYNVDGVLDKFHIGCRFMVGDALVIKDAIEKELGIPVLALDVEDFDPRYYNEEQYRKRLEIFAGMMKSKGTK